MGPRRFWVTLIVSRFISREIIARDQQTAEEIARYLYANFGDRFFKADPEDIIDVRTDAPSEGAAS